MRVRAAKQALVFGSFFLAAACAFAQSAVTDRYDDTFRKYTKRFFGPGYDWRLFKAQGMTESNLNPDATSFAGARGLMQLMPSTYAEIRSRNPEIGEINDPEWNIAAGIYYNRRLWRQWAAKAVDRKEFMFGSYNAGRNTIVRAQKIAIGKSLDERVWPSIQNVAPEVPGWRHKETLNYVQRIQSSLERMDSKGRIIKK
ncbi:MAG: transglycosylase SLT domain-containing protein [Acidobacteria bacterium]|nr:transglycosylase SLT domain-containing protein [Acidobacteriota bacterium]